MDVVTLEPPQSPETTRLLEAGQATFLAQSEALARLGASLGSAFLTAVDMMHACQGKVVICGMGKSGIVGRKIAATLASTGTPSFFVHPGEAYHGDLGMIGALDLVVLISYSGETDEVLKVLPYLHHIQARTLSITGNPASTLAHKTEVHLDVSVERESCPNNLAPTTSTTATLVMGDALAVSLMQRRAFMPVDFARFHPGGSLGRKLLTPAEDVMHPVTCVVSTTPFEQVVHDIGAGGQGIVCVLDEAGELIGVVTDGDLRRALESSTEETRPKAQDIMSRLPITVTGDTNLHDCEQLMRTRQVTSLVVVDGRRAIAVIKSFDA